MRRFLHEQDARHAEIRGALQQRDEVRPDALAPRNLVQQARPGVEDLHRVRARVDLFTQVARDEIDELRLQRIDAETLPFPDGYFDVVYSWGVIHHSAHPEQIIREIRRVLKPDGRFIGMMYARHSLVVLKLWVKHALLKGRPWRSWADLVAHHMESPGTKAYTVSELNKLWFEFSSCETTQILTPYDGNRFPRCLRRWFRDRWGFFIAVHARK